jgi:hypothetical protein
MTAYVVATPVSVIGGSDGAIDLIVSGGTSPYTYIWNNGQTSQDLSGLSSGDYTVEITDATPGCPSITLTAFIYEPYDTTGGPIIDSLYTSVVDTCLPGTVDDFYIESIDIQPNSNVVSVTWIFVCGADTVSVIASYTFDSTGNVAVFLTLDCGNKALTTYMSYIHVTTITSLIDSFVDKSDFLLFPNPAQHEINILIDANNSQGSAAICVYDMTGRMVLIQHATFDGGNAPVKLNVSQLNSGMYVVEVNTADGNRMRKSFVK